VPFATDGVDVDPEPPPPTVIGKAVTETVRPAGAFLGEFVPGKDEKVLKPPAPAPAP
jgi:hypothetical protein